MVLMYRDTLAYLKYSVPTWITTMVLMYRHTLAYLKYSVPTWITTMVLMYRHSILLPQFVHKPKLNENKKVNKKELKKSVIYQNLYTKQYLSIFDSLYTHICKYKEYLKTFFFTFHDLNWPFFIFRIFSVLQAYFVFWIDYTFQKISLL